MKKFLVVIPWADLTVEQLTKGYARVTYGSIEARSLEHAKELLDSVLADEEALLDLLIEPRTPRDVTRVQGVRPLASYGVAVGTPEIVPVANIGHLDLDWALAGFASVMGPGDVRGLGDGTFEGPAL